MSSEKKIGFKAAARGVASALLGGVARGIDGILINSSYRRVRDLRRRERERPRGEATWFTEDEAALIDVLASLIVPSDETSPGAQEADVVDTLDRVVATSARRRELYRRGLYSFDECSRRRHGRSFRDLPEADRLELLRQIERKHQEWETATSPAGKMARKLVVLRDKRIGAFPAVQLFPMLVRDVLRAFYTSPVSWIWLGYDGPPMPHGYPDLAPRRAGPEPDEAAEEAVVPSRAARRLRILVCLKQVPGSESRITINESARGIREENLVYDTNEGDLYALEQAFRLCEKAGGEVVVLSLGDRRVLKTLRDGLARGADRAIHLDDSGFRDADSFVAAKAMAGAIRRESVDMVLTGVESSDQAEAQIAGILGHLLAWPHAAIVDDVEVDEVGATALASRELGSNLHERLEIALPAVLAVQSGTHQPRYPTLRGILNARKKEIETLSASDLGLGAEELGRDGARIEYLEFRLPEKARETVMLEGSPEEAAEALIRRLHEDDRLI